MNTGEHTEKRSVAILQPHVPHYRTAFFEEFSKKVSSNNGGNSTVYCYTPREDAESAGFNETAEGTRLIAAKQWKNILWYNPGAILKGHDQLVLMWHFAHITTWLLLLTKWIHHRRIILWGQGISVKRYLKESVKPDWKLKWMLKLADGAWVYMPKEAEQWTKIFPLKPIVALQNTLSGVEQMVAYKPTLSREDLKRKHEIKGERVWLFCARFENPYRRTDLLEGMIRRLPNHTFIIIGDGKLKPDFSKYENVRDFGALYDDALKRELFSVADGYFQPGWVGLSIVEAMAYGLPIFTFRRSAEIVQCVEYSYIKDGENGRLLDSVNHCMEVFTQTKPSDLQRMGNNAWELVAKELTIDKMVERACSIL